jgi:protein ImuA
MEASKAEIISQLRRDVLFQRFSIPKNKQHTSVRIEPLTNAFHFNAFPLGAVHEFICDDASSHACSTGCISALIRTLINSKGKSVWLSNTQKLFPPAFAQYGLAPENIFFIQLSNQKDILFAMEEALKCEGLSAVVADIKELNFKQSRRLQLACEQSRVTGFVILNNPRRINTTACVARWRITPAKSINDNNLPGVGFPSWNIQLLKVKNGIPGAWTYSWRNFLFEHTTEQPPVYIHQKKAV